MRNPSPIDMYSTRYMFHITCLKDMHFEACMEIQREDGSIEETLARLPDVI